MLLSIVIPVYNTAEYLRGCVQSVLVAVQTLGEDRPACEIILVDDGATDGICPQLCDDIAAENPQLIRVIHQENKGLGGARNTGLEAATGDYVFFPDSDDQITSDALSVILDAIGKTHADIIAFDFYSDDGEGHHTPMKASYLHQGQPFRVQDQPEFLLSAPSAWSRVWKRSLFLESGIRYPSRVWYEDLRTSMKLMVKAQSVFTVDKPLYLYLQRPGSIMRSSNVARNREIIDAFDDLLPWFQAEDLYEPYKAMLGRLCIDHVYIAASVRVLRADIKHPLLKELRNYLETNFPDYRQNPYLPQLPATKKLVYRLLEGKHYKILDLLFRMKGDS